MAALFTADTTSWNAARTDRLFMLQDAAPATTAIIHGSWNFGLPDAIFADPFDRLTLALGK
jgi:hypothetical protein